VAGDSGDQGPALSAQLREPVSVAVDAAGNLYIADWGNNRIRRVSLAGTITTWAADLTTPAGLKFDAAGNLYFTESRANRVRRIAADRTLSTVAGNGQAGYSGDGGPATAAQLNRPTRVAFDTAGNIYISDMGNARVRRVRPDGVIETFAGTGSRRFYGDGGPGRGALLNTPFGVALDGAGNLYITDSMNNRVRRLSAQGIITTVAEDLNEPSGIAIDNTGALYIADTGNNRIRRIDASGNASTVATPTLNAPRGVAIDAAGNLFIADTGNNAVRRITPSGQASTVGSGYNAPEGVALDGAGVLHVADTENNRVVRVASDGAVTLVAGDGRDGFAGEDAQATTASLWRPVGLAFLSGALYIADRSNNRIRRVQNGVITTVIGLAGGSAGDGGPPSGARISQPRTLAFDRAGNLYIADTGNDRVRAVLVDPPVFTLSKQSLTFRSRLNGPPTGEQSLEVISSVPGIRYSVQLNAPWLATTTPLNASAPGSLQIVADPDLLPAGTHEGTVVVTAPNANPPTRTATVTFEVEPGTPPRLAARPDALTFSSRATQTLYLSNEGSTLASFNARASGGSWLRVAPDSGALNSVVPVPLAVSVDPEGLSPGTYSGAVSISLGETTSRVPVTVIVSSVPQSMLLSQTGLTFTAVARGGAVPPQTFGVLNLGRGVMNWQAETRTDWLTVTPSGGSTDAASLNVPLVEVGVRHANLEPGDYYGQIRVTSATADNSPQYVTVVLTVLPPGSDPGPLVRPTGLIFTMAAGGAPPGSQAIRVANLSSRVNAFTSGRIPQDPGNWFTQQPADSAVAPDQPVEIIVQPNSSNRPAAGVQRGTLTLQFADGTARTVSLLLVVAATAGASARREAAGDCAPSRLLPVFTALGSGFRVPAAWPATIEARVVDDCGVPLAAGTVIAGFSNGDPPLALTSLRDGRWVGSWQARNASPSLLTVTVSATEPAQNLTGTAQISGSLDANSASPLVERVNDGLLAPGGVIDIQGAALAAGEQSASESPLPTEIGETLVAVAGTPVPLFSVSPGRIRGVLPYEIAANTRHQVIVQRGVRFASSGLVTVAPARPVIVGVQVTGNQLVIRATGLGAVDPVLRPGLVTPAEPVHKVKAEVEVRMGETRASNVSAALLPGETGMYEVRADLPAGAQGEVTLAVAGQISAPAPVP
jgi:uncharacterized protein (TIGR03437 family)